MPNRKFIRWFFFSASLVGLLFYFSPLITEILYGQLIYPSLRLFYNTLSYISPIPLLFIFIIYGLFSLLIYFQKLNKVLKRTDKLAFLAKEFIYFALFFVAFFYWSWGMNYFRPNEANRFGLEYKAVEKERLKEWIVLWTEEVNQSRSFLTEISISNTYPKLKIDKIHSDIESGFRNFNEEHGLIGYRHIPIMLWWPKGLLLRNSTAGFYFPFTGEATLDSGLHPYQTPFTIAHEMAHSIGFTDEGICNLLALIVCLNSENIFIQYSGKLTLWRYLAREVRKLDPEFYTILYEEMLADPVKQDLLDIYRNSQLYPDWFPGIQRRVYDTYLRAHGISAGIASYNQVLMLTNSYFTLFTKGEDNVN